jgi:hypothetical protein
LFIWHVSLLPQHTAQFHLVSPTRKLIFSRLIQFLSILSSKTNTLQIRQLHVQRDHEGVVVSKVVFYYSRFPFVECAKICVMGNKKKRSFERFNFLSVYVKFSSLGSGFSLTVVPKFFTSKEMETGFSF